MRSPNLTEKALVPNLIRGLKDEDGFDQVKEEQQSHSGTVGGGTPYVVYTSNEGGSGGNNRREVPMVYPNARIRRPLYKRRSRSPARRP
jgi:hypothetical protein